MSFNIGPYIKAVEAVLGGLVTVGGAVLSVDAGLPAGVVAGVTSALAALTAAKVWLVKNETVIEEATDTADAVVELGQGIASAGKK